MRWSLHLRRGHPEAAKAWAAASWPPPTGFRYRRCPPTAHGEPGQVSVKMLCTRRRIGPASRPLRARLFFAAVGAGLLSAGLGPPPAGAATQAILTGSVSPAITDLPTSPRTVALSVTARFVNQQPGQQPAAVRRADIYFPHGSAVNSRFFPSCTARRLDRRGNGPGVCPDGSRIGGGEVIGVAVGITEQLRMSVYNGPRGRSVLFYLRGVAPVRIAKTIEAPLRPIRSHRFAYHLTLVVPPSLQRILGLDVAVSSFTVRIRASVRRRSGRRGFRTGYVEVWACPPGALVPTRGVFSFANHENATVDSYLSCR